jgi:hypothetical protein
MRIIYKVISRILFSILLTGTYKLTYNFFELADIPGATTYTRSISQTPVAKRRASKVGLCPTSACSIFFSKMDAVKTPSDAAHHDLLPAAIPHYLLR